MFRNYFIVACRNFFRNKVFSLINVSGLAIGISASLVIYLIVSYEFGFDKFEKDRDRIYRVVSDMHFPDKPFSLAGVPAPLPEAIRKEVSAVEVVSAFHVSSSTLIKVPASNGADADFIKQDNIVFADDNYFKLFNHEWLAGNPASLNQPFKIILSQSRAKTYFGSTDWNKIIGRTIIYQDSIKLTVTSIVKEIEQSTDLDFKVFISISTIPNSKLKGNYSWSTWQSINGSSQCFVKLNKGVSPATAVSQIQNTKSKYFKDDFIKTTHALQPFADIHFDTNYLGALVKSPGNKKMLYGLLIVAGFLLLLGCINFINLTTAQSIRKAKETGIRKTMGSSKRQLIELYLTETFLLTSIATLLSVLLAPLLLKIFSEYIPKEIGFEMVSQPHVLLFLALLTILISLLAGFYPAIVLTRYNPAIVLKSQSSVTSGTTGKAILRKSLTVTQFIVAQFFILATLLVGKQIYYSLNKDLGFKKNAIITIQAPWPEKNNNYSLFLQKIKAMPAVEDIILGSAPPAREGTDFQTMSFEDGKKKIETTVERKYGDSAYFNLYQMKLLAGKYLRPADSISGFLINDTYAKFLGFKNPADIVGKFLDMGRGKIPIVGVLADIHSESLHASIKPLAFTAVNGNYDRFHIALKQQDADKTIWKSGIGQIQQVWKEIFPADDFEYEFFDESIARFYRSEQTTASLLKWATGLSIFISCLGLLGLAIYTTNQRRKEIGVRKVLGASIPQIVLLLSKDFIQLILLAFIIATPLAWWAMHEWLQDFAYRTTMSWWIFAAGGALMIIVAMIVLSARTIRSASANPVESLRNE